MPQILLQNATANLLQNATKVYCKMRQVFSLQNVTVLLQNATVFTKCNVYYKLRQCSHCSILFDNFYVSEL